LPVIGFSQTDAAQEFSYTISGAQEWIDTGTDLKAGDNVTLTAESKSGTSESCSPAGSGSGEKLAISDAPAGALIARTSENGTSVLVGAMRELHAQDDGHLFLEGSMVSLIVCSP
jgi:hypothetical protein